MPRMPRCQVKLLAPGPNTIEIIKALRERTRPPLGLYEAKHLVDHAPQTLSAAMEEGQALELRERLEELGCRVELCELPEVRLAVRVESAGPRKIEVIKVVREALGLGLKDAKDRVDSAPFEEPMHDRFAAEALARRLCEAGADARVTGDAAEEAGPPVAAPPPGAPANVVLEQVGPQKISVIKVVREHLGLGLAETKRLVESAPVTLREACEPGEARRLLEDLGAVGARARLEAPATSGPPGAIPY